MKKKPKIKIIQNIFPSPSEEQIMSVDVSVLQCPPDTINTIEKEHVPLPERSLTAAEISNCRSIQVALYLKTCGGFSMMQIFENTRPGQIRTSILSKMSDLQLVGGLISSIFYKFYWLGLWLDQWKTVKVSTLINLIWTADFTLRVDDTFVYFFPDQYFMLCHRIAGMDSMQLFFLGELTSRLHLWTKIQTSRDRTVVMLDGFCFNPELRAMFNRTQLTASIVQYVLNSKESKEKIADISAALELIDTTWNTRKTKFRVPLNDTEWSHFQDLRKIFMTHPIHVDSFNRFTFDMDKQYLDIVDDDDTDNTSATPESQTVAALPESDPDSMSVQSVRYVTFPGNGEYDEEIY